jgi:hypothetical protein
VLDVWRGAISGEGPLLELADDEEVVRAGAEDEEEVEREVGALVAGEGDEETVRAVSTAVPPELDDVFTAGWAR